MTYGKRMCPEAREFITLLGGETRMAMEGKKAWSVGDNAYPGRCAR